MKELKLYMLLLGSKAPGRNVEQHDYFFGIASSLKDMVPAIKKFWRGAAANVHIDGWREVNTVNGYTVKVVPKTTTGLSKHKLFLINLGGYTTGKLEEQHYAMLTVQPNRAFAIKEAKQAAFFQTNSLAGVKRANAHIDDKYGIDVDDIYQIKDLLSATEKANYQLEISQGPNMPDDEIHLGYFRLDKL